MENKPKKSKALIITIIAIILLLIAGYLIFKNRDAFGVKTSASIAKIFSPLISSTNSKNLATVEVEAGEALKKGDNVSVFGTGTNNIPIVMKTTGSNSVFGSAYEDINSGNTGQVTPNTKSNSFFNSFANFLGGVLGGNKGNTTPPAGGISTTPPTGGWAMDSNTGKWNFDPNGTGGWVFDSTLDKWTPPSGLCPNGADNPPDCNTIGGKCLNFANNPPLCTINPEGSCINGATNPLLCTIGPDGKCLNNAINTPDCTNLGGDPDLIAGNVAPTGTTINTPTTLSSTITNIGGSSTVKNFSSFFTIARTLGTAIPIEIVTITPVLEPKIGSIAKITYSFNTAGEYQIRACADKKSSSDAGAITESNEDNNCGPWTTFTVTNSLPTLGDLAPGDTTPPGGGINPPASSLTPYVNQCLAIEQNPLTFTPEEKARLAILLRKFYLISSTLKTTEDITTTYNEIDQQKNFISQIEDLTKQCYVEATDSMMLANNWVRHGNPWYTETTGGSFPYTSENTGYLDYNQLEGTNPTDKCKVVSGYYYGTLSKEFVVTTSTTSFLWWESSTTESRGSVGENCDKYNSSQYITNYGSCTTVSSKIYATGGDDINSEPGGPNPDLLQAGCNWKEGVKLDDTERILNIW